MCGLLVYRILSQAHKDGSGQTFRLLPSLSETYQSASRGPAVGGQSCQRIRFCLSAAYYRSRHHPHLRHPHVLTFVLHIARPPSASRQVWRREERRRRITGQPCTPSSWWQRDERWRDMERDLQVRTWNMKVEAGGIRIPPDPGRSRGI